MKNKLTKTISALLLIIFTFSLLSISAFAENDLGNSVPTQTNEVADGQSADTAAFASGVAEQDITVTVKYFKGSEEITISSGVTEFYAFVNDQYKFSINKVDGLAASIEENTPTNYKVNDYSFNGTPVKATDRLTASAQGENVLTVRYVNCVAALRPLKIYYYDEVIGREITSGKNGNVLLTNTNVSEDDEYKFTVDSFKVLKESIENNQPEGTTVRYTYGTVKEGDQQAIDGNTTCDVLEKDSNNGAVSLLKVYYSAQEGSTNSTRRIVIQYFDGDTKIDTTEAITEAITEATVSAVKEFKTTINEITGLAESIKSTAPYADDVVTYKFSGIDVKSDAILEVGEQGSLLKVIYNRKPAVPTDTPAYYPPSYNYPTYTQTTTTTIEDEETPLGLPNDVVDILDEETPLGKLPKSGAVQPTGIAAIIGVLFVMAALVVKIKKGKNERIEE